MQKNHHLLPRHCNVDKVNVIYDVIVFVLSMYLEIPSPMLERDDVDNICDNVEEPIIKMVNYLIFAHFSVSGSKNHPARVEEKTKNHFLMSLSPNHLLSLMSWDTGKLACSCRESMTALQMFSHARYGEKAIQNKQQNADDECHQN